MKKKKNSLLFDSNKNGKETADALSDEELKILASVRKKNARSELPHYDNSDIAKAKRYAKANKLTVIFVVCTIVLVLAVISVLSVLLYQKIDSAPSKEDFTVQLGDESYTVKYKNAMKDGVLYLDLVPIAQYAGLVISGDERTLKITCEDGTYVRFENDKSVAHVNGEDVKLGGEAKLSTSVVDGQKQLVCDIPFDFIRALFSHEEIKGAVGLYVVDVSKSNKIQIHRLNFANSDEPIPISFSADCFSIIA